MNAIRERLLFLRRPEDGRLSDDFHLVNFTVGLFAINCFLLVTARMAPFGSQHADLISRWFGSGATIAIAGVAILAFVLDCGWKAWHLGPARGLARFVVLSSVLAGIVALQVVLSNSLV